MNKYYLFAILLIFSITARSEVDLNHRVSDFYGAITMFFEQKHRAKDILKDWKIAALDHVNEHEYHVKGGCYRFGQEEVLIVLQVESDGLVSKVYASKDSEKANCIISAYKDAKYPKPPFAPLYSLQRML